VALTVPTNCLLSSKATFYSTPDREAEYCDECVCVCVCVCVFVCLFLCDHIFGTTHPIFTMCFVCVTYGHGSVLLWWRNDTLYIHTNIYCAKNCEALYFLFYG